LVILKFPAHQISWVINQLIEYAIFSPWTSSAVEIATNDIWHKGSPGDEDDAWSSNTRIPQRKRAMPHSTMKNMMFIVTVLYNQPKAFADDQSCCLFNYTAVGFAGICYIIQRNLLITLHASSEMMKLFLVLSVHQSAYVCCHTQ